ncbi:dTDP-4-dehydrorhamnose reductase [Paenibacillus alvei]|uniref:dTDP-4-dehydrorhamnose reductase n=1 Tax=Paenibacillus alvei TaxID=44250 RepID=A0A383RDQ1_PAEAL|nr:dTDP-4-dehydrorhamnose reductase [Paenibacillus alvei]SYX85235.1 dTDP-4-dehydrorhamnose reductase [Paenibacillus alvei]
MRVLITGAHGQLSSELIRKLSSEHDVFAYSSKDLDITSWSNTSSVVRDVSPDVVIHSAAITNIDKAEGDPKNAYLVNSYGTRNVAVAAEQCGSSLLYLSSAYVFDGTKAEHGEYDNPRPLNVYGESKLGGELFVRSFHTKYWIVRTSWLYGENFIRSIIDVLNRQQSLKVSPKQIGSPTSVIDLAAFIQGLIRTESYGIYHVTNSGRCNKFEYYREILRLLNVQNIEKRLIKAESLSSVPRPPSCSLGQLSIMFQGFEMLRPWDEALEHFMSTRQFVDLNVI